MATLEIRGVTKSFGEVEVIRHVDLEIGDGEFVVFVGPSGCGKSTLLRIIAGLESASTGQLLIDGADVTTTDPSKRGIAMVFQTYALYPHMTVEENMGFGLEMAGVPLSERRARVAQAARTLHLDAYLSRKPRQLSGGQRQRVAIGRAIVRDPKIFLFDEPLSNLDAELRVRMRIEIARLHADLGATMIYVTHDQVEAMTLASRIVVLRDGRIEQVGAPLALYGDPDNLFVAGFIGSPKMNLLPARVSGRTGEGAALVSVPERGIGPMAVRLRDAGRPLPETVVLGIRPEHVRSEPVEGGASLTLTLAAVEHLGGVSYGYASGAGEEPLVVELRNKATLRAGDSVTLFIDPADCFLFDPAGPRL